jgi:protein gp37
MAKRLKGMGSSKYQTDGDPRTSGPGFGVAVHPGSLDAPLHWRKPRRIFVNSMADLFHDKVSDEFIADVFAVMALASQHTFQVLTKRHARMRNLLSRASFVEMVADRVQVRDGISSRDIASWPLPNVWLGVSVENQPWADIRIPALLDTPAAVRWLSCEPLLSPVDLTRWLHESTCALATEGMCTCFEPREVRPDWVVVGGESGPGARPMHPDWARSLRDQCQAADLPFLFKQWGDWGPAPWAIRICDPAVGWQGTEEELEAAKRDAEAHAATHLIQPWGHLHRPVHKAWSMERDVVGDYPGAIRRWGKGAAGRVLDGRTWDGYPAVG